MADLNELRNRMRAKKHTSDKNPISSNKSEGRPPSDFKYSANSDSNKLSYGLDPEIDDITVVLFSDHYVYFLFGGTDKKIKIAYDCSGLKGNIQHISKAVDNMTLPRIEKSSEPYPVFTYLTSTPSLVANANLALILYSSHPKSFVKAMQLQATLSIHCRLVHIAHIGALGKYGLKCAQLDGEEQLAYGYGNRILTMAVGDGVFEIKEDFDNSRYDYIELNDLLKGSIYMLGIHMGNVKDLLLLNTLGQDIKFIVNDGVRDIHEEEIWDRSTTIPVRRNFNLSVKEGYKLKLSLNGDVSVTKSCHSTTIRSIECHAYSLVKLNIKQGNRLYETSLYNFFFSTED